MLQGEITPFATAHRDALDEIISQMLLQNTTNPQTLTFTTKQVGEWVEKLRTAQRGFDRFEACALDEWKQKMRYRDYAMKHSYPFS